MLNRTMISSGRYLENFKDLPAHIRWSPDQIEQSLQETMCLRPDTGDLWLFGYGSLIWNPVCRYEACRRATLHGWHRSFCIRTTVGRASPLTPGRMLSLEPGGVTHGVALRLPAVSLDEELRLLWIREMATGAYRPTWSSVTLEDGSHTTALIFVAKPEHPFYDRDVSVLAVAPFIATAVGPVGTNADYLFTLKASLAKWHASDDYVDTLVDAVQSIQRGDASLGVGTDHANSPTG
ncbi:gamma-glutamylcyclotransferase [Paraburkholderia oxyphila]|uniref:gamma-glutamylcyclotransferase n=1 Tax=Paraburkholderia oxyphila TaxID=614212 RepID=UPI0005B9EBAB|nr:gamma-glutamylcyclotransferase [Paraburkholderia oxyphila]